MFRQTQHLRAIGKERRTPLAEVEATTIEFGEESEQTDGCTSFISSSAGNGVEKIAIGKRSDCMGHGTKSVPTRASDANSQPARRQKDGAPAAATSRTSPETA
jgi:hypothetical protein